MSGQEKRVVRGHETHVETAAKRKAHALAQGFLDGVTVYQLPSGKVPFTIVGKLDTPVKFLLYIQHQGTSTRAVSANPFLLTKERPKKAKKPGSRH